MNEQSSAAQDIRCSVCGDPGQEGHRGTLWGNCQNDSGQSDRYLVHLCKGCFFGALTYLRQEREIMHLFYDEPPARDETFGLLIDPKHQAKI